jgi:uncharacterized protein
MLLVELDFITLADWIEATQSGAKSSLHGSNHWRRVAAAGLALADSEPQADRELLLLFALLHDSQRLNDNEDPLHPARAADFAATLDLHLSEERMATLLFALRHHTDGQVNEDPTIAVCWDADRLNLWRVGIQPSPDLLSTPEAKKRERIIWGGHLQRQHFEWPDLLARATPEAILTA